MKINVRRLGSVTAIAVGILIAAAAPASAGTLGTYNGDGVRIRSGPSLNSTALGMGYFGQQACTIFATTGDSVNGNPFWDYHSNLSTGVTGYSADEYMYPFYYGGGC